MAAPAVGLNPQFGRLGKEPAPFRFTPPCAVIHGEGRRVGGLTDIERAAVVRRVIAAVGYRTPFGLRREVMHLHACGVRAPTLTSMLEVAHQLSFLSIHAQTRVVGSALWLPLFLNLLKWGVAVRRLCAFDRCDIHLPVIVLSA